MPMNAIKVLDGRCDHCQRRIFPGTRWVPVGALSYHVVCFEHVPDDVLRRALLLNAQG